MNGSSLLPEPISRSVSSSRSPTAALELPFDALPHGRFRGLLLPGLLRPLAPEPTPTAVEAVHDRGELRVLRLVGLALRVAAGGGQHDRPGRRARGREAAGAGAAASRDGGRRRGDA